MRRRKLRLWEALLILFSVVLSCLAAYLYFTDFPVRKYFIDFSEEGGNLLIGQVAEKAGSLRRQVSGGSEFATIDLNAPLYNMDTIVSGPESNANLTFENGGSIQLGPSTMVRLAFQTATAFGGINRVEKVDVVSGQVTGRAGKRKLVIASKKEVLVIKPKALQTVQIKNVPMRTTPSPNPFPTSGSLPLSSPSPNPRPSPTSALETPAPSPSPTKSIRTFTPEEAEKVKISPPRTNEGLSLAADKASLAKKVALSWKMNPPNGKAVATIWRIVGVDETGKPRLQKVFSHPIQAKGTLAEFMWKAKRPGKYQWEIKDTQGEPLSTPQNTHGEFEVPKEIGEIQPLKPLVGGKATFSNRIDAEGLSNDFNITIRWQKFPSAKQYKIWFGKSRNAKKPVLEKTVTEPMYTFNKNKVIVGDLYYRISTVFENGFTAESPVHKFSFSFASPAQVSPPNNASVSLKQEGNPMVITWEKTSFTEEYELEISRDATFGAKLVTKTQKENYFVLKSLSLGQYWWRVRSVSKEISSPFSPASTFTVKD